MYKMHLFYYILFCPVTAVICKAFRLSGAIKNVIFMPLLQLLNLKGWIPERLLINYPQMLK